MFSSLERKHYIWAAVVFVAVFVGAGIISFGIAPRLANQKMLNALSQAGFTTRYIQPPRTAYGAMLYTDVTFDPDAFSTAKYMRVTYNPFLLVLAGKFKDLDIIDLNLTGNWSTDAYESLSFAGWKKPSDLSKVPLTSFKHINISKSRLAMMTQNAGGLSVFFDGTSTRGGSKTEFQGNIKSEQKYLSLVANASGVIEGPRWYSDVEIIDGKFEDPSGDFRATRLSGWINLANPVTEPFKIMSQLRSGGLSFYGLPWQAASSTIDFSSNDLKIFTEAKSVGYDGLELELNLFKKYGANVAASGIVHGDKADVFFDYFRHDGFKKLLKDLAPYKNTMGIDIDFLLTGGRNVRYEIKKDGQSTGKSGTATFAKPAKTP